MKSIVRHSPVSCFLHISVLKNTKLLLIFMVYGEQLHEVSKVQSQKKLKFSCSYDSMSFPKYGASTFWVKNGVSNFWKKMESDDDEECLIVSWVIERRWQHSDQRHIWAYTEIKLDVQPLPEGKDCKKLADDFNPCFILKQDAPVFTNNCVSILRIQIGHAIRTAYWHVCTFFVEDREANSISLKKKITKINGWYSAFLFIYPINSQDS